MIFNYEATDKDGAPVRGQLDFSDERAAIEHLSGRGLVPVRVEEAGAGATKITLTGTGIFESVSALDRIVLVRNLAASLRAGLTALEALDILIVDAAKNVMRQILTQAKINLENGQNLSQTFASYKKYFPPVFVGMVRAGEFSGRLDGALEELGRHISREYVLVKKIKSALAYPILLIVASTGVIALLLIFVLPRLAKAFRQSKVRLPAVTQALLNVSGFFSYSYVLDTAVVVFAIWFFIYFRKTETGRRFFARFLMKFPLTRELVKKVALVRLTRTLGSLIASGATITESLKLAADSVSNEIYEKIILEAIGQVESGVSISDVLRMHPKLFPNFLISLTAVGEKTGTLEKIFKTFADFYDEEIDNTLKDLTSILEPALLLIMGLIIGAIAVAILLPIYQLVGSFK